MIIHIGRMFTKKSLGRNCSYEEERPDKETSGATSRYGENPTYPRHARKRGSFYHAKYAEKRMDYLKKNKRKKD